MFKDEIDKMKKTDNTYKQDGGLLKCIIIVLLINVITEFVQGQPDLKEVEQWDIFELSLEGPQKGNPFVDVRLTANFTSSKSVVKVNGFYDGDGRYLIRFMPEAIGGWSYVTESNVKMLDGKNPPPQTSIDWM